ncbi:MAG: monofunctional biosynthetic peptidoglycan transglycosylase [Bacteroidales bacterium]|nr:monofunctional biosynthetic peptidoglycan transglycosylase [Bacteroidales bacterium]
MAKKTKKSKKEATSTSSHKFWKVIGKIILILFIVSIALPLAYRWINPPFTPLMVIRKIQNGTPIEKEWRDLDEISHYMVDCAVAAEDNNFLAHRGFDWGAVQKAINDHKKGKSKRGASTISQQTAKNVFLWPGHSWVRKAGEVYFTFLIETFWSKERIMEVYLNVIEMGDGIYGAEAAAQHYFQKSADKLTLHQCALITACYPAPLSRNPGKPTSYLNRRAGKISGLSCKIGRVKFDKESIEKARQRYEKRKTEWYEIDL